MELSILEFLNTDWIIRRQGKDDPLYNEEWLDNYLTKVMGDKIESSEKLSFEMTKLRTLFIKSIEDLVCGELNYDVLIEELNKHLAVAPSVRKIISIEDKYEMRFKTDKMTDDFILAELCFYMYQLLFKSEKERIRICENPDCKYIFFDTSRNKSKRHCYEGCANIMKVRRFRDKYSEK
ncbi:MAG: CGNR zinc finger domain-containing protein [Clostridiales bacterium]|nr:CGNR zinc finger domain-containing protein [Clostridiales bacterium]